MAYMIVPDYLKLIDKADRKHDPYTRAQHADSFVEYLRDIFTDEELQGIVDAKAEGRLVELPCKAGDPIYHINIDRDLNKPPLRVTGFRFLGFDNEGWIEIGPLKYRVSEIGKTVFLTREEAEKALKGEQK